ncbi:MAG: hypothetical protein KDD44_05410 [Bdellovibrionales bacterium]|nr:hypothetical protein [Bdellovibrionales bacterium]
MMNLALRQTLLQLGDTSLSWRQLRGTLSIAHVRLLQPRDEKVAEQVASIILLEHELGDVRSPAANRLACAVMLDCIRRYYHDGTPVDSPTLPLIHSKWLKRFRRAMNRVRFAMHRIGGAPVFPFGDRFDDTLDGYVAAVLSLYELATKDRRKLPPVLEAALVELLIEALTTYPRLTLLIAEKAAAEARLNKAGWHRVVRRIERSVERALGNPPVPGSPRYRLGARQRQLSSLLYLAEKPSAPSESGMSDLVDLDSPPAFFESNVSDAMFRRAAAEAPRYLRETLGLN